MYSLIGISLVLLGIAGLQFTYLFYMDRLYRERKKYLQLLERKCADLTERLAAAEIRLSEQDALLESVRGVEQEAWADVIEER
jgi:hypothetical protein